LWREKLSSHVDSELEVPIPSSLERLETLTEQADEKFEKFQGTTRDAAITARIHM